MTEDDAATPQHRPRRSASADASAAAERARLREMTPVERMSLALELGRRCRAVARDVADAARAAKGPV